jgi:hypothetical protein
VIYLRQFVLILLLYPLNLLSQDIVTTSGQFDTNTTGSLSWTLGEIVSETITDGTSFLTQGFQQPYTENVGVFEQSNAPNIQLFPNPFHASFSIVSQNFEGRFHLKIIDNSGKIVHYQDIEFDHGKTEYLVTLLNLASGFYQLHMQDEIERVMNCRIVKY